MTLAADVNFTRWMASIDGTRTDSERQCWPPAWPNGSKCTERAHRVASMTEHKVLKTEKNKKCLNYDTCCRCQLSSLLVGWCP